MASLRPDIILLTTPHGVALTNDFAIYKNSAGAGFASLGSDLHNASFPQYRISRSATLVRTVLVRAARVASPLAPGCLPTVGLVPLVQASRLPPAPTLARHRPTRTTHGTPL